MDRYIDPFAQMAALGPAPVPAPAAPGVFAPPTPGGMPPGPDAFGMGALSGLNPDPALEAQFNAINGGMPGAAGTGDPFLDALIANAPLVSPPPVPMQKSKRKGWTRKPNWGQIHNAVNSMQARHQRLLDRFSRDLAIYRQHDHAVPRDWSPEHDPAFISAALSNLLNKFASILSAGDIDYRFPFSDSVEEQLAQDLEDYCIQCRDERESTYAWGEGGSLKWDEFFYGLLYGRYVARVLPDPSDPKFPADVTLLDPATVFTHYGGGKKGLLEVAHVYEATDAEVISIWGRGDVEKERKIWRELGHDGPMDLTELTPKHKGVVKEWWNSWYHAVEFRGVPIVDIEEHGLGRVPFVYVMARGEPKGLATPNGRYPFRVHDRWNELGYAVSSDVDAAEKGVSIFHHIIHAHRIKEQLFTILFSEIEKAANPPTITYTAPQLAGKEPPPLNMRKGGNNQRVKGLQEVEGVPTSPRPTDVQPTLTELDSALAQGGAPPGLYGAESGSNISGFAENALITAAKEILVPYTQGFQHFEANINELILTYVEELSIPLGPVEVYREGEYGDVGRRSKLTSDHFELIGKKAKVKLSGIARNNMMQQIQTANAAIQGGLWTQKRGMDFVEVRNPTRELRGIHFERAMQHPKVSELFVIPAALEEEGAHDLAAVWQDLVYGPGIMQHELENAQMQMMGAMGGGGSVPGAAQGMSNPMMGAQQGAPGGPARGQGRGPAR